MEKFKELVSLCKASVDMSVNEHKDYYESVEQYLCAHNHIEKDILAEMINRDTIVRIQAYPRTPVSYFVVYHYDIDKALEIALDNVKND